MKKISVLFLFLFVISSALGQGWYYGPSATSEKVFMISTTALSLTASGTTIGSGNTQDAAYVLARTLVLTGVSAGRWKSTSATWTVTTLVSATSGLHNMRWKLQRRNSSSVLQTESGYVTKAPTTVTTYTDDITWTSGTWAANDELVIVWEHHRASGTGNKNSTVDANGASYITAPYP